MTVKELSDEFVHLSESIDDLRMSLCVFVADCILAMPIGLPYEDWVVLHQLKGDWDNIKEVELDD